ncbi:MAG TPA: cache domain-containing protein [Hymenobacter sp.]|jgi:hypothetical protein|uniref:cache domain-containing protein n=1 Tax=Hymenobacter sp. TaxID=1898978 RepID=UPI002EDB3048
MASLPESFRRHAVGIGLSLVFALGVAAYVMVYLPQQEASLRLRYFRVVARIGENLKQRTDAFAKRNEAIQREVEYKLRQDLAGQSTRSGRDTAYFQNKAASIAGLKDHKPAFSYLKFQDSMRVSKKGNPRKPTKPPAAISWLPNRQQLQFAQPCQLPEAPSGGFAKRAYVLSTAGLTDLVSGALRRDVFGQFMILGKSTPGGEFDRVYYSSFPTPATVNLQAGLKGGLPRWLRDTTGIQGTRQTQLMIAGQSYQLFVEPLRVHDDVTWLLCGAVPTARFNAERQALPGSVLEVALALIVLSVLALPVLKILLMSAQERLSHSDVLLCSVALVLGTGMLMLISSSLNARYFFEPPLLDRQLTALSNAVIGKLEPEVKELNVRLRQADHWASLAVPKAAGSSAYAMKSPIAQWSRRPPVGWPFRGQGLFPPLLAPPWNWWLAGNPPATPSLAAARQRLQTHFTSLSSAHTPLGHLFPREIGDTAAWQAKVDRMLWVDDTGEAVLSADGGQAGFVPNLRERIYFQQAMKEQFWPSTAPEDAFLLASVVNYGRTSDKTAVLVRRSTMRPIAAANGRTIQPKVCLYSTELRSLAQPVLPPGYSFCLMDQSGEVLFHSDPNLSLSENLLQDCEPSYVLQAAMLARTTASEQVQYQGRQVQLHIRPVGNWPVYLVTLADLHGVRARQVQTLSLAATLWGGLAALGLLFTGALLVLRPRRRTLLAIRDSFSHLWPRTGPRARGSYRLIVGGVGGGILLLFVAASWAAPLTQLFLVLLLPLYLFGFTYRLLRRWPQDRDNGAWVRVRNQTVAAIALVNLASLPWLAPGTNLVGWEECVCLIGFQLSLAAFLYLYRRWHRARATQSSSAPAYSNVDQHAYAKAWLAWVVMLSLVPALYCYHLAYQAERELQLRHAHLRLFQALGAQVNAPPYTSFFFDTGFADKDAAKKLSGPVASAEYYFRSLVTGLHPAFDTTAQAGHYALARGASWQETRAPFFGPNQLRSRNPNAYSSQVMQSEVGDQHLGKHWYFPSDALRNYLSGDYWRPRWRDVRPWLGQMLSLGLLLTALYWLLRGLHRRIYNLDILKVYALTRHGLSVATVLPTRAKHRYLLNPEAGTSMTAGRNSGLRHFDCRQFLPATTASSGSPLDEFMKSADSPGVTGVVLENFDFQVDDAGLTLAKVALLRQLLTDHGAKELVVVSRRHPMAFGDCGHPRGSCPTEEVAKEHGKIWAAGDQLLELLADFQIVYETIPKAPAQPTNTFPALLQAAAPQPVPPSGPVVDRYRELYSFVCTECNALPFLRPLLPELGEWLVQGYHAGLPLGKEDVILLLQRRAQFQFRSLWNSLSPTEHYLLYDLAQDGLVNSRNALAIENLLHKGLLVFARRQHKLLFVNESFRNYILSSLTRQQALRIEQETSQGGTWASVRLPLFLLLAAVGVFIFVTQRSAWSEAQTYLTALTGVLPLLYRLLSLAPLASSGPAPEAKS